MLTWTTAAVATTPPAPASIAATIGTMSDNYEDEPPHLFATASDGEAFVKTQCQELRRDAAVLFILPVACVCSPKDFQYLPDVPLHWWRIHLEQLLQLSNEQILSCLSLKAGLLGVFVRGKFQSFKVSKFH